MHYLCPLGAQVWRQYGERVHGNEVQYNGCMPTLVCIHALWARKQNSPGQCIKACIDYMKICRHFFTIFMNTDTGKSQVPGSLDLRVMCPAILGKCTVQLVHGHEMKLYFYFSALLRALSARRPRSTTDPSVKSRFDIGKAFLRISQVSTKNSFTLQFCLPKL